MTDMDVCEVSDRRHWCGNPRPTGRAPFRSRALARRLHIRFPGSPFPNQSFCFDLGRKKEGADMQFPRRLQ